MSDAPIRVESAEEQYAFMLARFGDPATWNVIAQTFETDDHGEHLEVVQVQQDDRDSTVRFASLAPEPMFVEEQTSSDATGFLDRVMESASEFSAANPPHHPGTLARFPVPSASYPNALAVAMPVIALENGRRGLFAPPRVVVLDHESGTAKGVGEFPGFNPENWPPKRLGEWPPEPVQAMHRLQMQGTVMRFSALWKRILDAWFSKEIEESPALSREILEALLLRAELDPPAMQPYYERLNPVFAKWLDRHSTQSD